MNQEVKCQLTQVLNKLASTNGLALDSFWGVQVLLVHSNLEGKKHTNCISNANILVTFSCKLIVFKGKEIKPNFHRNLAEWPKPIVCVWFIGSHCPFILANSCQPDGYESGDVTMTKKVVVTENGDNPGCPEYQYLLCVRFQRNHWFPVINIW